MLYCGNERAQFASSRITPSHVDKVCKTLSDLPQPPRSELTINLGRAKSRDTAVAARPRRCERHCARTLLASISVAGTVSARPSTRMPVLLGYLIYPNANTRIIKRHLISPACRRGFTNRRYVGAQSPSSNAPETSTILRASIRMSA